MARPGGVILDLDGTLVLGDRPLPGSRELLLGLEEAGVPFAILTNNSSLSARDHAARLARMGLPVLPERLFTSGAFAGRELARALPGRPVYLLGTPSLAAELAEEGVWVSENGAEAVLVGFDTTLTYARLARAAALLQRGVPYFATHPDPACPAPEGFLPDAGAILALLEKATGRRPDRVFGKPDPAFLWHAAARLGLPREGLLYVGDRLEVDVALAQAAGVRGALVLGGATRPGDPRLAPYVREGLVVVEDLWALKAQLLG